MGEFTKCSFSEASQIILGDEPSIQLLMSRSLFFLSCFILNISSTYFFFTSLLGCFESLSNDEFSVYYFFVFFFLTINYAEFSLFENLHSSLFNDFTAEYIQHRLHFLVKVEEFVIALINLSRLAIFFCWHLRLE